MPDITRLTPIQLRVDAQTNPDSEEYLAVRCERCKRPLKSLSSRRLGLGPSCAAKLGVEAKPSAPVAPREAVAA